MPRLSLLGAALALVASGSNVHAQEVVKIDTESGRTIIDDEWRSMYRGLAAVDWDRKLLYVGDREEPDGIMVFSLETGEHVRTISTPRGDGPQELRDGRQGIALKPDGGAYISGYLRVLEFDPAGNYLASWSPVRPPSQRVCDFGGAPAVAIQDGVVRRGPNGEDQVLGSVGESGESIRATTVAEGIRISTMLLAETHIVCTDEAAYVVAAQEEGPATVTIYRLDGSAGSLEVPVEGAASRPCTIGGQPCPHWSRRPRVSLDDHDNLVILGADSRTHGSISDPETGCYALIHADGNRLFAPAAIHADSALVFYDLVTETRDTSTGRIRRNIRPNSSPKIAMHPIRRHSGEPCEGILPNVPPALFEYHIATYDATAAMAASSSGCAKNPSFDGTACDEHADGLQRPIARFWSETCLLLEYWLTAMPHPPGAAGFNGLKCTHHVTDAHPAHRTNHRSKEGVRELWEDYHVQSFQ